MLVYFGRRTPQTHVRPATGAPRKVCGVPRAPCNMFAFEPAIALCVAAPWLPSSSRAVALLPRHAAGLCGDGGAHTPKRWCRQESLFAGHPVGRVAGCCLQQCAGEARLPVRILFLWYMSSALWMHGASLAHLRLHWTATLVLTW